MVVLLVLVGRKPVCICGESPGGILSGTHGKCGVVAWTTGLLDYWTTTPGGDGCDVSSRAGGGESRVE